MYEQLKLEKQLCFRLYTVSRLVTQAYRPYFMQLGITYPQYLVLLILWERDNLPVSDIASRLMLDTNTVTPLLQRMEREGLVARTRGTMDSRQRIVSLTPRGRAMQEKAKDIPACLSRKWEGNNPSIEEIVAMTKTLDSMIETLKQ